jgi:hypothetical protein
VLPGSYTAHLSDNIPASFATLAAIRLASSRVSGTPHQFDEILSRCQIEKAPAVKHLSLSNTCTSVMWLDMSRLIKIYYPAA